MEPLHKWLTFVDDGPRTSTIHQALPNDLKLPNISLAARRQGRHAQQVERRALRTREQPRYQRESSTAHDATVLYTRVHNNSDNNNHMTPRVSHSHHMTEVNHWNLSPRQTSWRTVKDNTPVYRLQHTHRGSMNAPLPPVHHQFITTLSDTIVSHDHKQDPNDAQRRFKRDASPKTTKLLAVVDDIENTTPNEIQPDAWRQRLPVTEEQPKNSNSVDSNGDHCRVLNSKHTAPSDEVRNNVGLNMKDNQIRYKYFKTGNAQTSGLKHGNMEDDATSNNAFDCRFEVKCSKDSYNHLQSKQYRMALKVTDETGQLLSVATQPNSPLNSNNVHRHTPERQLTSTKTWRTWRNIDESDAYDDVTQYILDNDLLPPDKRERIASWVAHAQWMMESGQAEVTDDLVA